MKLSILAGILAAVVGGRTLADENVVRVSVADGDVTYLRGDDDARDHWTGLGVNTPLTTGDAVYVGVGGRVELCVGPGQLIHFDGGTELELTNIANSLVQVAVNMGRTHVTFRQMAEGSALEIDTSAGAATGNIAGEYQTMVDEQKTSFEVVSGALTVALDGREVRIEKGKRIEIKQEDKTKYSEGPLAEPGEFEQWAKARGDRIGKSEGRRAVNPAVVGTEDLDEKGWKVSEKYGKYWAPTGVRKGWAPCRDGRWIWKDPDGWTWIADEPWGWVSCHYGRWIHEGGVWGWVPPPAPGAEVPEMVGSIPSSYSPAVVGFIGGTAWDQGRAGNAALLGWVPLAPEDRVVSNQPALQTEDARRFALLSVDDAATVVRMDRFGYGRTEHVRVSRDALQVAPVLGIRPRGVVPSKESLIGFPERRVTANGRPSLEMTKARPVVWRREPPKRIQSFAAKLPEIRRTGEPYRSPVLRIPTTGGRNAPDRGRRNGASPPSTASPGRLGDRGTIETGPKNQRPSRGPARWGPDQKPKDTVGENQRPSRGPARWGPDQKPKDTVGGRVPSRAPVPQTQRKEQATVTSRTNGTPLSKAPRAASITRGNPRPAPQSPSSGKKGSAGSKASPAPKPAQNSQAPPKKN